MAAKTLIKVIKTKDLVMYMELRGGRWQRIDKGRVRHLIAVKAAEFVEPVEINSINP